MEGSHGLNFPVHIETGLMTSFGLQRVSNVMANSMYAPNGIRFMNMGCASSAWG